MSSFFFDFALYYALRREAAANQQLAQNADAAAQKTGERVAALEEHLDRVTLFLAAASELLAQRAGVSAAELHDRVREIDLRDGTLDGRITTPQSATCTACARTFATRHRACIYCGAPRPSHPSHRPLA